MTGRCKYWFIATALGILPLILLACLARPAAAAGPWSGAPGGHANTCQAALPVCATIDAAQALQASSKTVNHATSQPSQPLRYAITLSNSSNSPIDNVMVTDTLPSGLSYTNGSLTATTGHAGFASGVITWTGTLTSSALVTVQFDVSILGNQSMGTVITNTAVIGGSGPAFSRTATTKLAPAQVFLPVLFKAPATLPGIQGHVTFNRAPADGVSLELCLFDGQQCSTPLSLYTDGSGFYNFTNAPSLLPGQSYYVLYLNHQTDSSRLSFWGTAEIKAYAAGSLLAAGDFDLANVPLVAPNSGATVSLPAPFQWAARAATPTDSYQLSLFNPKGSEFGQTNPLGYVNGVILTGVPNTFHAGTPYGWYVAVNSPDGGYGESYYYRSITFNNILAGSQPAAVGGAVVLPATPPVHRPRP